MTGKHRGWHRRWIIDLAACTATHDSGLIVTAERSPEEDGYDFHAANLDAWQTAMLVTMPMSNLIPHAQRLLREAAEAYQYVLRGRH